MPNAFILTYNPEYWLWPANERTPNRTIEWNVGNRRKGIAEGDHLFLLQQGASGRGLIAHAYCAGTIFTAPHWLGPQGRTAQYIHMTLTSAHIDPIVDLDELRLAAPHTNWAPRQSGSAVNPADIKALISLWQAAATHLDQLY